MINGDNISNTAHRLNTCRKTEGVPASIGAFIADALPDYITSKPFLSLSFPEIPTSFYMGISNQNYRSIILSDVTSKSRHMKYPSDKAGVLVRSGKPKDYIHYLEKKRSGLKPVLFLGWDMYDPAKFDLEMIEVAKNYRNEFSSTLFIAFHQGNIGRKLHRFGHEPTKLWSVEFKNSLFERDIDKAVAIYNNRDDALRGIRFLDDKVEERKAIRERTNKEIESITKNLPFFASCFFISGGYPYTNGYKAVEPKPLDMLAETNMEEWQNAATLCRTASTSMLASIGAINSFEHAAKALQAESDAKGYILDLGRIPTAPTDWKSNKLELGNSLKVKQNNMAGAFLNLDDTRLQWFNSAEGRPTGISSALLSRPNLLGRGAKEAADILKGLGYELDLTPALIQRLEKKKKFYKFQESPLHELQGHELVAYYDHGKYACKETIINPDNKVVLWRKGKEYEIIPTWAKMMYAGGTEPIVNEANKIIGIEELAVRLSYLQLKVQTESGLVTISENQCRDNKEDLEVLTEEDLGIIPAISITPTATAIPKAVKGKKAAIKSTSPSTLKPRWVPMLDEFITAFGLPNVPTIMDIRPELIKSNYKKVMKLMPDLKSYQVDCCVRNATKKGGILGGTMGSGKTRMMLGTLLLRDHMFNLVIVPPMLIDNWMEHFKKYGLYAEKLLDHESINILSARYKALKGLEPKEKRSRLHARQEFYVTTPEFLTLGGIGNVVYDEWVATYESKRLIVDPITGEPSLDIAGKKQYEKTKHELPCTKYHAKGEHTAAKLTCGTRHSYGDHIKECPKCQAKRDQELGFTDKGVCKKCGHVAFGYKGAKKLVAICPDGHSNSIQKWIFSGKCPDCEHTTPSQVIPHKEEGINMSFIDELLEGTKGKSTSRAKLKSFNAYPAYKRIGGIFGAKAIDEVHLLANFNSQRGLAVFGIKTKETWVASGTIARGYVTDLEASLCHVHGANTPIFPFYPWGKGREGFREQFVTERVKSVTTAKTTDKKRTSFSPMPEASNLNRLRRMLNCVTTTVGDNIMEKEWKLPSIKRTYEEIWLNETNQTRYLQELTNIRSWFSGASEVERHRGALQKLWNLRLICDGEEKEQVIEKYVIRWLKEGHKFILTASTVAQYKKLKAIVDRNKVKYLAIDEKVPADKRDEVTSGFADPNIQALISRTKLINVGLNTLIHADRLLICSLEYSPDTLRQMEKRICRPGQLSKDLQVIYPIVRMKPKSSVEEKMLKLVLEKELAVKEMMEGKVRWQSAAELLEAAREKKGAAKVLQDVTSDEIETTVDDTLFTSGETITGEELYKEVAKLEKGQPAFEEETERVDKQVHNIVDIKVEVPEVPISAVSTITLPKKRKVITGGQVIALETIINLW